MMFWKSVIMDNFLQKEF